MTNDAALPPLPDAWQTCGLCGVAPQYTAAQMREYAQRAVDAALAARGGQEPVGYVWVETHTTPDSPNGPAEYNEELCFDTSPPTSGPYTPVFAAPPAPCPHIRSSGEGTHWCALAEQPALPTQAREAMEMALDALENERAARRGDGGTVACNKLTLPAIAALRAALGEEQQ